MIDNREVRHGDRCGAPFRPGRELQRFCTKFCHDHFYTEEKRQALAAWRAQQRALSFFDADLNDATRNTGERRRA